MAFADRTGKPSVDRALLRNGDPSRTQGAPSDAIVSLKTRAVRGIDKVIRLDAKGKPIERHTVDVQAAPEPANDAHALIVCLPELSDLRGSAGRRLLEALARLEDQSWAIPPIELRQD